MKLLILVSIVLLGACVEVKHRGEPGLGSECERDSDCAQFGGVCDVEGTQACVVCSADKAEACTGTTPVCGESFSCRACAAHADCASDTCLPDGSCAAAEQVVYLQQGGTGTGCSKEVPCGTLEAAIAQAASATRPYVRITGTIENAAGMVTGKALVLFGSPGAALKGGVEDDKGIPLELGLGAKVEMYELAIQDSKGVGIKVDNGASLSMVRSKVTGAAGDGVLISNGTARIEQSEISNCGPVSSIGITGRGIYLTLGELTVSRSRIVNNAIGISIAERQKFTITNNFIVGNKLRGGLLLSNPASGSKLEFNTIADNHTIATAAGYAGGVACEDASFTFATNIIYRNTGGSSRYMQTTGLCKFTGSFLSSSSRAETASLGFVDTAAAVRDYHLTESSPATVRDVAGGICSGMTDFDGDPRAADGGCDLGADEYKP